MTEFKKKTLLVITSLFPDKENKLIGDPFVKDQIDQLKNNFKEIIVFSTIPITLNMRKDDRYCKNYSYDNVKVYYPRFFHLPISYFRKRLLNNMFNVVYSYIRKNNITFDLIHAHFILASGYIGMKLKEKYNVPLIITGHGGDVYDIPFRNKKNYNLTNTILMNCDHIVTVSKKNKQILIGKLKIKSRKIFVIPNGFDIKLFKPLQKIDCRKKLILNQDKKIILNIGNLVPVKNHKNIIVAFSKLCKKRSDVLLYIIGEGPEKKDLLDLVKKLNLTDLVFFVGSKKHSELPLWYNSADLFILPSYNEGNPTVIVEAASCSIPVIASKVGGIPDIINSLSLGFVINNPKDYNTICYLLNKGLNKKWDYNYIHKYSKKYSWQVLSSELLKIYSKVL